MNFIGHDSFAMRRTGLAIKVESLRKFFNGKSKNRISKSVQFVFNSDWFNPSRMTLLWVVEPKG